jgi:hypothetical protein
VTYPLRGGTILIYDKSSICYDVRSDLMREEKKIAPFKTTMLILAILLGGIAIAG